MMKRRKTQHRPSYRRMNHLLKMVLPITFVSLQIIPLPIHAFLGSSSCGTFEFVKRKNANAATCSVLRSSLSATNPPNSGAVDPTSRFHTDMHRVLKSRENLSSSSPASLSLSPFERRKRPALLTSDVDGAERVASMLQHMVDIGIATEESYQIVLKALSNRGRLRWRRQDSSIVCAADEVGTLFDELRTSQRGNVTSETCNTVLKAYAACATPRGNRQYAQKAQALLQAMEASGVEVTVESLSYGINAWAWQQENLKAGECAKMAQLNFDQMVELSPDNEALLQGYHWLLEAWSKSASNGSADIAGEILDKMIELGKVTPTSVYPNAQSYSNAILAWTKNHGKASAEKAQVLLEKTLESFENGEFPEDSEPELIAFNGVLSAWARIGRADKAEEVLWMADKLRAKCKVLVPDVVSYNSVLHAYVRSRDKSKALDRVLAIVKRMEDCAEDQPAIAPDSFTYNTVLKAWIQSGRPDAIEKAEDVLHYMYEQGEKGNRAVAPSNRHFNIVINALAKKSKDPNTDARKAYDLLLQMQSSRSCTSDIISYTSVIECFSKSTDPDAAEISMDLLEEATTVYEETGNPHMMPNLRTYTMAILALSANPTITNVGKARALLDRLLELYEETQESKLEPNAFPYNYVLNCAANCIGTEEEKVRAFQIGAQTYNDMRHSKTVKPDSYTYAFWFKCCNNLLPLGEVRTKGITLSFEQCKQEGLVSSETLRRLLAGSPPELVAQLLDKPQTSPSVYRKLTLDDIPLSWSRNVKR